MPTPHFFRALAVVIPLSVSVAAAQFAPPDQTPGTASPAAAPTELPSIIAPVLPDVSMVPTNTTSAIVNGPGGPLLPVRGNQALTTNAMLGMVNSKPIWAVDIFRPIDAQLRGAANNVRNIDDFRQIARNLIRNQIELYKSEIIITAAAEATLTERDIHNLEGFLEEERNKLISKYGGSVAAVDQALAPLSSLDKAMADRRREVIVQLYRAKNISPKVVITRQMVLDAYQRDPKKWQQDEQLELFQLTLPIARWLPHEDAGDGKIGPAIQNPTPEQVKEAETKAMASANDIYLKLKNGPNTAPFFAKMVEDSGSRDGAATKGGRTAGVKKSSPTDPNKGTLNDPRLESLAFSLAANTLAQPVLFRDAKDPTLSRVVILKVGERLPARAIPFSEAQTEIERTLRESMAQKMWEEHLEKLYQTGAIEAVDRMTNVAVEAAITRYATGG